MKLIIKYYHDRAYGSVISIRCISCTYIAAWVILRLNLVSSYTVAIFLLIFKDLINFLRLLLELLLLENLNHIFITSIRILWSFISIINLIAVIVNLLDFLLYGLITSKERSINSFHAKSLIPSLKYFVTILFHFLWKILSLSWIIITFIEIVVYLLFNYSWRPFVAKRSI